MRKELVPLFLVGILLAGGLVKAAWYTTVKPGIVAGEDTDGFNGCVAPGECGYGTVYAMGEWKLPPRYERALIAFNHNIWKSNNVYYYRYDVWHYIDEVGTRAYFVMGAFGAWYTALVPAPALAVGSEFGPTADGGDNG